MQHELDLRGVRCPLNWARATVRLDDLQRGDHLVLLLDDPRSLRDIPQAAEARGHVVHAPEPCAGHWRLTIEV